MQKLKYTTVFLFGLAAILFIAGNVSAQSKKYFSKWEKGFSPQEIGKRVAENYVKRKFEFEVKPTREFVIYPEVITWYGALTVAEQINDKDLQTRLNNRFDRFFGADANRVGPNAHVDYRVFGIVPIQIYLETKNVKYLDAGKSFADKQWEKTTDDGISAEARYWIDDMYMITILQVQAYRATKDKKYLDRAALTAATYLAKLQQSNGLFYHADDSFYYWGRGNGWFAAGMAELLSELPKNHPQYAPIMKSFKMMSASLLKYQAPDGLWRQLVDKPESWEETSGSAMFAFAMVTGVKRGWLDGKTYGAPARKAWLALVAKLDEKANLKDVCVGTNKGYSVKYYLDRDRETGNLHGQAPMLWTASALLRK